MLKDKRCLVTGGSRGLGREFCVAFARAGAKVAFTYSKDDGDADDARAKIAAVGTEPLVFKGSVADAAHVRKTVDDLASRWGGIDVLVNNAALNQILPIALLEEEDWDAVMNVNVKGAYLFSRAALRHMIKARRGRILNVGAFSSERVIEAPVHFAASKSALRGLTEALAREVGRYSITVNLLAPGLLEAGMAAMLPQHRLGEYLSQCALARTGTAAELATAAVFLVSDENTFMTGAKLVMDGGL
ncbi:MAG TPA: SDR family oxidoreductase [Planctomycetota bacterium]|nr:SDR family oxidoreductase [Planctomycetota bacterium]